jgi:hypothetical protein
MATVTTKRPRVKPARHVRFALRPFEGNPGVLDITAGKHLTCYYLYPMPSDFGSAFRLDKFGTQGGETYHVNLADDGRHSCECLGFLHHGHCKHVAGLLALRRAGRL